MTMLEDPAAEVTASPAPEAAVESGDKKGKKGKKGKGDKEAKGKSNLVPAIVLAVGIAAGGFFMSSGGSDAGAATPVDTVEPEIVPGEMVTLEPMTLNLAGGRFLRVSVAFLTDSEFEAVAGDAKSGGSASFYPGDDSRIRDQLIVMFGGREASTLAGPEGLAAAKAELLERANEVLDGHVIDVYLTEFVMQ